MKKIIFFVIFFMNILTLKFCESTEYYIKKEFAVFENGDFIIASNERKSNNTSYYFLLGLSEKGKNKDKIVFPRVIDNHLIDDIGLNFGLFGNIKNYPFVLYNQKSVYLNKNSRINSNLEFRQDTDLKLFIPYQTFLGDEETTIKFLKENNKNNIIYYSYIDYKKYNKNSIYNLIPANLSYYINDYEIFFIDDVDNSKVNVIPPIPYLEDYVFDGWYLDKNFNKKFDFQNHIFSAKKYDENGKYIYEENKVYAKWIKKD